MQSKVTKNERSVLTLATAVAPIVAWIITLDKKEYRIVIQGLLPEVARQYKLSEKEIKNLLSKWLGFTENNKDKDKLQLHILSKLLKRGVKLTQWSWFIALLIGAGLITLGILADRMLKNYYLSSSGNEPEILEPECKKIGNYIPVAELAELRDNSPNFKGGNLIVKFTANGAPNDCLAILNQGKNLGEIGVNDSNITYEGNVVGSFKGGEGTKALVVSFNENATREAVQATIRRVAYSLDKSQNISYGDRTIEFQVTDGNGGDSLKKGTLTQIIQVVNENNPININLPNFLKIKENTSLSIDNLSIAASSSLNVIATLEVKNGTLLVKEDVANDLTGDDIKDNESSKVTISGTVAQINNILGDANAVIYRSQQRFSGTDFLSITVKEDRGRAKNSIIWPPTAQKLQSINRSINIEVEAANPGPVIEVASKQIVNENEVLGIGPIKISDPNNQNVNLTLEVKNGKLTLKTGIDGGLPLDNIQGNGTSKITLRGSIERINTHLAKIKNLEYQGNKNYNGRDTLMLIANDGENTTSENFNIIINDHPSLDIPEFVVTSSGLKVTKPEASNAVKLWIENKKYVFGGSFNNRVLQQHTTGKYYDDVIKGVRNLRSYGERYIYNLTQVVPQKEFYAQGNQVIIHVKVTENYDLLRNGVFNGSSSNEGIYRWTLQFEDNRWKIADRETTKK